MAFASGSITLKRFFVQGPVVKQVDESLIDRLSAHAIGKDSIVAADKTEIGWVTGDHILDTQFSPAKNAVADGLHFALRIDTNRPPSDLVRSYQRINEQAMLEASGRDFLSRAEKREAREQAKARADKEARAGAFRRSKQIPVFWDCGRGELYFGATGSTAADQLMLLFRETFDRSLTPASAGEIAGRWSAMAGETRAFDDCHPAHLVNPPDGADVHSAANKFMEGSSRDFLGTEWLTWLWYASHVESPEVATGLGKSVTVLFEKTLQLECAYKMTGSVAITCDAPTRTPEAPVALSVGKRPIRAGLHLAAHGEVFSLGIRGDVMHYTGVQLPEPDDASTPREVFHDRMDKLRNLIEAVGETYNAYLKKRLSSKWPQVLNAMRSWVAGGRHVVDDDSAAGGAALVSAAS